MLDISREDILSSTLYIKHLITIFQEKSLDRDPCDEFEGMYR